MDKPLRNFVLSGEFQAAKKLIKPLKKSLNMRCLVQAFDDKGISSYHQTLPITPRGVT